MTMQGQLVRWGVLLDRENLELTQESGGFGNQNGFLRLYQKTETLADDAGFDLKDATDFHFVLVTDGTEYILAVVNADGSVTAISTSTNASATDTDTDLCLFDNGTAARVRNRLGSEATVRVVGFYAP